MAYAIKYLFKFESSNGTTREIRVLQDGYTGEVIQRPLGRAPILKKQQNGPVHGTSLEFFAECNVDREFIEFYTSDPKAYRVDLYAGATLLWQGYITPELYSEPDIAPPYDVQVVATDGVGELKLYEYAAQGAVTLRTLLSGLLSRTGLGTDIYLISSLKAGSRGAGALLDMTINLDYMAGESCYDVLTYLLDTLHATITWWKGAWILSRETNVTFTSGKVRYFNTAGNSALLNDSVQVLGKMYANPAWPVGQLSTVIDPAKNRVTVQAPWHVVTCLRNPDMGSDADWTKAKNARYETDGYVLPVNINTGTSETAVISQATSMAGLRVPMSLSVKATGATSEISAQVTGAVLGVLLTYKVGNVTYHLVKGDDGAPVWQQGGDIGTYIPLRTRIDFQQQLATWDSSRIEAEELTIDNIPPFLQGTTFPAGTLTVYILGYCAKIYGAYLDVVLPKGYQDILRISNGARGEGGEVEIAIGRETADNAYYAAFLQGLLLDSGNLITSFSDANFSGGMDYLAFIARDYALSVALPRAKVTGTVYLESGIAAPPLVFTKGALNYWLQTWSWNLYEDELEIEGLTLPSASLTVESETILESTASASSSTGRTSGGGAPISPGTSMAAVQEWVNSQGYLASVEAASTYATITALNGVSSRVTTLEGRTNWDTYFGVDENGDIYVKKNGTTARNFYSWGAVSAGGLSSGGGSEGASLAAVWASLKTNSDDYANEKINAYHIPIGSGLSVVNGLIVANNAGTVTSVKVGTTTYNPTDGVVSLPAYPTSLPASDVYSWAKAETKPSYAFSEITGTASTSQIPTLAISKISGLQTALDAKQPIDDDLTAIAALTGTSGFLKKTAANTWALDTNTYLTGITSTMVTNALGYTPWHASNHPTTLSGYGITDWLIKYDFTTSPDSFTTSGIYRIGTQTGTSGTGYNFIDGNILVLRGSDDSDTLAQVAFPYNSNNIYFRRGTTSNFTSNPWKTIWNSGNSNLLTIDWACKSLSVAYNSYIKFRNPANDGDLGYIIAYEGAYGNTLTLNGAQTMLLRTGGTDRIMLDASGNVGIYNSNPQYRLDVTGDTRTSGKLYIGTSGAYLEYNSTNGVHLVVPSGKGFYTEGFISAGGVSSGGGSEGVNLTAVWDNLVANTGEGLNKVINVAHIPALASISGNLTVSRISDIETWISGKGYLTSLSFAGLTSHPTTLSGYGITDWLIKYDYTNSPDSFTTSGIYRVNVQTGTSGTDYNFNYGNILVLRGTSSSDTITQVAFPYSSNNIYFRTGTTSNFTSNGWKTILNSANYTTYINTTNFPGLNGNQTITLSGDVSGSGATSISVSIGQGKVTNAMLAGSIANGKLANSAITINGSSTSLGGSFNTASITAGTAGQSGASTGVSFSIPYVTMNKYGIVTAYGTHTHTISASDLTTTIGSTTYAPYNSAGYLPLTGGTLKNSVYTEILTIWRDNDSNGAAIRYRNNTGLLGFIGCRGSDGAPYYSPDDGITIRLLYHSGNSNLSTVPWACSTLTASGNIRVITTGAQTAIRIGQDGSVNDAAGDILFQNGAVDRNGFKISSESDSFAAMQRLVFYSSANGTSPYTATWKEAMRISSAGHVSLGTTSSNSNLTVNGNIVATGTINSTGTITAPLAGLGRAGGNGLYLNSQTSSGTGYYNGANIVLNGAGTYWRGIGYSGLSDTLTIGPCSSASGAWASSGSITLRVVGHVVATGAITAGAASDARLKTNIRALSTEVAKRIVMNLNPVTFTWNEKATELYDQYKGDDLGMIAQEVEPYLPQAVGTIFENYKRLDYTKVISPLVKVAQDHESRICQLEAENRELRKEVERLRMN